MAMTRKYGIELEIIGMDRYAAARAITAAGVVCRVEAYGHTTPRDWKTVTDASLDGQGGTCEVVSPPLFGEDGLNQIKKVCEALNAAGADVNRTCGFHVHIDAAGMTPAHVASIVNRYARYERNIDGFMPPSRRGNGNLMLRSMAGLPAINGGMSVATMARTLQPNEDYRRYFKINLTSYVRHGTIEFRQHSGTINYHKVSNWIRFVQEFVDQSAVAAVPVTRPGAPVVDMILNRTERLALEYLRRGPITLENLAANLNLAVSTAGGAVSRLRTRGGYTVTQGTDHWGNRTFTITDRGVPERVRPRPVVVETADSLWAGIDPSVHEYYRARAQAFGGEVGEA